MTIPRGACDCHMHFYGPPDRYPLAATRAYDPPLATVEGYRQVMARLGTERVVAVQPSAYGTDNQCLVDAITELGDYARGIATVRPDVSDSALKQLTAAGVRGARALMFKGSVLTMDELPALAARVAPFGWHVQLQMNGRDLPGVESMLAHFPVDVVIDHNGKFEPPVTEDHVGVAALKRLLDRGRCWVKASAPYETSRVGPPGYEDVGALARVFIRHAPERVVWASNWPHGGVKEPLPDDNDLLGLLEAWAPDEATRKRILVDNPRMLYGFR